jgi:hypothetical protein
LKGVARREKREKEDNSKRLGTDEFFVGKCGQAMER